MSSGMQAAPPVISVLFSAKTVASIEPPAKPFSAYPGAVAKAAGARRTAAADVTGEPDAAAHSLVAHGRRSKLAAFVVDRVVADIAANGWRPGQVVGSEAELLDRYDVSRAVLREAVRLLEHLGVARMRQGPGGGLVVLEPTVDSVTDAVSVYLFYVGAEIDEVFEARLALEEVATELAPTRLEEHHLEELRALVEAEKRGETRDARAMHNLLAAATGNPALAFFVDLLNRVTLLYLKPSAANLPRSAIADALGAHEKIADAILAGDAGLARRRMRRHLLAEAAYLRTRRPSRRRLADLPEIAARSEKRAEQTARQIFREVATGGWQVGTLLGSEAELMERYDVSRAVLREAVRVLEHHQVARMRRGPGGGLFVVQPGPEAVTNGVALQVNRLGIKPLHLFEVRGAVEMAALDLVMSRLDRAVSDRLRAALEAERAATTVEFAVTGHDIHGVLAAATGNRVIELLVLVLLRLSRFHMAVPADAAEAPVPTQDVIDVHRRIVEAILAGDADLARHRLRRHLDALVRWSR
jgi:DNA-binding FadR family transcriptional regulator